MFIAPSDTNFLNYVFMGFLDSPWSFFLTPMSKILYSIKKGVQDTAPDVIGDLKSGAASPDVSSYFTGFEDQEQKLIDAGYGDLVGANYWSKLQFNPGILDKLGNLVGFRSAEDKFWENARMQYGEYLAGLEQQKFANEYDSESARVARMREAGENPDLLGTGDVAGAAAPAEDTNNAFPEENALSDLNTFTSILGDCFNFAVQNIGFIQEFQSNRNNLLMQRTQMESGYQDFVNKFILNNTPSEFPDVDWADKPIVVQDPDNPKKVIFEGRAGDYYGSPSQMIADHISSNFKSYKRVYGGMFSKKQWRHINRLVSHHVNGLPVTKEQWSSYRSQLADKVDFAMQSQSEYYDSDFDELRKALDPLINLNDDIRKLQAEYLKSSTAAGISGADYQKEYYDSLDGSVMAGITTETGFGQLTGLGLDNYLKELNNKVESARNGVITTLRKLADDGNVFAKMMLFRYSLTSTAAGLFNGAVGPVAGAAAKSLM